MHKEIAIKSHRFSTVPIRNHAKISKPTNPTATKLQTDTADVFPMDLVLTVTVVLPHRSNNDQSISVAAAYVAKVENGIISNVKMIPIPSG